MRGSAPPWCYNYIHYRVQSQRIQSVRLNFRIIIQRFRLVSAKPAIDCLNCYNVLYSILIYTKSLLLKNEGDGGLLDCTQIGPFPFSDFCLEWKDTSVLD